MNNNFFHNYKINVTNLEKNELFSLQNRNKNINVNINKLLNRVKIEEQNEKKQKAIFFCLGVSLIGLMGLFVSIIR